MGRALCLARRTAGRREPKRETMLMAKPDPSKMAVGPSDTDHRHGFFAALAYVDRMFFNLLKWLVGIAFLLMIVCMFVSVAMRELGFHPFPWIEEAAAYLLIWSVFLGAAVLARRSEHINVDIVYAHMPLWAQKAIDVVVAVVGVGLAAYFSYLGLGFTMTAFDFAEVSLSGYLQAWTGYAAIPVGLALTALAYLLWLAGRCRSVAKAPDAGASR